MIFIEFSNASRAFEHIDGMEWVDQHEIGKINKKMGMCYRKEGKNEQADECFKKALRQMRKEDKEYNEVANLAPEEEDKKELGPLQFV